MILCMIGMGLGGEFTSQGIIELQKLIKQKYPQMNVQRYRGERLSGVIDVLTRQPEGTRFIIGGYSWGADNVSIIAARLGRPIEFAFALQPSVYYPTTPLGPNVKEALCVYNPWWFETAGLGFQKLALAQGNNTTKLSLVQTHDSHPYVQYDPIYRKMIFEGIDRALT